MMMSAFSFSPNSPPDVISSSMYIEKALAERFMSSLTRTGGMIRCISLRSFWRKDPILSSRSSDSISVSQRGIYLDGRI